MMKQKLQNIWYLFYLFVFFIIVTFLYIVYDTYDGIYKEETAVTRSYAKILRNQVEGTLKQDEVLLDILSEELVFLGNYKDKKNSQRFLRVALQNSHDIIGFGLTDTHGNLLATSANIDPNKYPNIITNEIVKQSFEQTLQSDAMVVGRPYFFKPLQKWVLPIRKTIRNNQGVPVAVMTAGIINEYEHNIMGKLPLNGNRHVTLLSDDRKTKKLYRMFHDAATTQKLAKKLYAEAVNTKIYTDVIEQLLRSKQIQNKKEVYNGNVYCYTIQTPLNKKVYGATAYLPRYKLWVVVIQPTDVVWYKFLEKISYHVLFLFIVLFVLYRIFLMVERKEIEKNQQVMDRLYHDNLTGLYSREYLATQEHLLQKDKYHPFQVVMIDLENFKSVNERFGHKVGDVILQQTAKRLEACCNNDDILVRQGADEFIIVSFSHVDFNLLQQTLMQPYTYQELEFRLGAGIGVAKFPDDSESFSEVLSMADIAMHEAKKQKITLQYFNITMLEAVREKTLLEQHLRKALGTDEIFMVYQPQISCDGVLHGVEALVRWNNPELGFVTPDRFIPVAEERGLIISLGKQIMQMAMQEIQALFEDTGKQFHLSINLSVVQLVDEEFFSYFTNLLHKTGFNTKFLTLEITESLAIEEFDYVIPLLEKIRNLGVGISLDDFGTGYSSLSVLNQLPITELKR